MKTPVFFLFILLSVACSSAQKTSASGSGSLDGSWELIYIAGARISFGELYPRKKPFMVFDLSKKQISGNTSCNGYSAVFEREGSKIKFGQPLSTMMACPGDGEQTFVKALLAVSIYQVQGDTLELKNSDGVLMRLRKK